MTSTLDPASVDKTLASFKAAPEFDCDGLAIVNQTDGTIWLCMVRNNVIVQRISLELDDLANLASNAIGIYNFLISYHAAPPGTVKQ